MEEEGVILGRCLHDDVGDDVVRVGSLGVQVEDGRKTLGITIGSDVDEHGHKVYLMTDIVTETFAATEADPQMKSAKTTISPADRFAAIMWNLFTSDSSINGIDVEDAFEKSGLAESRPMPAEYIEKNIKGTRWERELEVGDHTIFLTPEGLACIVRGNLLGIKESDDVQ